MIEFCFVLLRRIQGIAWLGTPAFRHQRFFKSQEAIHANILTLGDLMLTRFVISRLVFNGPDVELSEAASITTVLIPHSTRPSSLGEMARRMLIPFHDTGIHADKISIAKKRESLSQEKAVISVRDKKLIVQRVQGDPEALKLLFESCPGQLFACALRILPRLQDAEDAVQDFLTGATSIGINAAMMQIQRARSRPVICWEPSER